LIDLDGRVLGAEILIEAGQQLIAARLLVCRRRRVRENQLFAKIPPEQILHEAHLGRLRADNRLGVFNELAIFFFDTFECFEVSHPSDLSSS